MSSQFLPVRPGPVKPEDVSELVRGGIMQVLIGTIQHATHDPEAPKLDARSIVMLVQEALTTHAWCVREDMARNLKLALKTDNSTLDRDVVNNLITISIEERERAAGRLAQFAYFQALANSTPIPEPKSMN